MLIKCIECGGQVSDKAKSCPHCGVPPASKGIGYGDSGFIRTWWADRKTKILEKRRIEQERLQKIEAEKRERQEREARFEYRRNFSYSSMPYFDQCYASIDCAKVRKSICSANSYQDIIAAFSEFETPEAGYAVNLPWLKEWASIDLSRRTLDVLYVSFCMFDQTTCDDLIHVGCVLNHEAGCKALVKLASDKLDERSKAFIDRYVDLSPDSLDYYQKNIRWLTILDTKYQTVPFYRSLGLKPRIGDDGLIVTKRGDLRSGVTGAKVAQIYQDSPLRSSLDANDLNRIKFLLKWGANTEQWMFCCYRYDSEAGKNPPVTESDPLLYHIQSVDSFKLMTDAGMDWYPCSDSSGSSRTYNLIDNLWQGDYIVGTRLELLNYLYDIDYDKPLRHKKDYYRQILCSGTPLYEKNRVYILNWLNNLTEESYYV